MARVNNLTELAQRKAEIRTQLTKEQEGVKSRLEWISNNKSILIWEWVRPKQGFMADILQAVVPPMMKNAGNEFASKMGKALYEKYLEPIVSGIFGKRKEEI
jgi:hypothetical protein